MKINLDYHARLLIKKNIYFVLAIVVIIISTISSIFFTLRQYNDDEVKITSLKKEIADLVNKKNLISFKGQVIGSDFDLEKINQLLTQLIPQQEDFFSIILSLEKLSQQSKFIITSYNIIIGRQTPEIVSLQVEGNGDPDTFLEFLKTYKFGGGRLITINKIQFSQKQFTGSQLLLNFYSGKGAKSQPFVPLTQADNRLINEVLQKTEIVVKPETEQYPSYTTKPNPF